MTAYMLLSHSESPGSTVGNATKEESISFIAQCLNKAHKEISSVITVIENMVSAFIYSLAFPTNIHDMLSLVRR